MNILIERLWRVNSSKVMTELEHKVFVRAAVFLSSIDFIEDLRGTDLHKASNDRTAIKKLNQQIKEARHWSKCSMEIWNDSVIRTD